ncbi:RNA-binding protein 44-like [Rhinatrema bivittatum]|uniref:RNA-binding protein 44-like n=1 Tax=Rhinatrema bivittatum TaxID=194408 RepID=UPI0011283FD1|nr:RNA-binding protein 44-like [Rhinatrema bivittatum]
MGSNLFTILAELESKYNNMKEKLLAGIPLDALPPMSVESRVRPFMGIYVPSKLIDMAAHSEEYRREEETKKDKELEVSSTLENEYLPLVCSSDNYQLSQSSSVNTEGGNSTDQNKKKENRSVILEQQIDKKNSQNNEELNESWFDAKENQTAMDLSDTTEGNAKESTPQTTISSLAETKMMESSANESKERFYVFVVAYVLPYQRLIYDHISRSIAFLRS